MKKRRRNEMRLEYDFSEGVRGKYIARLSRGSNVVVLDADVAAVYRDSKSVNGALRKLAGLPTPRKRATRARPCESGPVGEKGVRSIFTRATRK